MIGVSVGVDVDLGVGDSSGTANAGSFAGGGFVNTSLGTVCGDDAGDASDDLEWRGLENGVSTNKETAVHRAATMAKATIQCPKRIDCLCCRVLQAALRVNSISRHNRSILASHSRRGLLTLATASGRLTRSLCGSDRCRQSLTGYLAAALLFNSTTITSKALSPVFSGR